MSSPTGSSPGKHLHRKPGGPRHKDDWLSRLHRRHDAHHHSDREQQAALLADDHADDQSEPQAEAAAPPTSNFLPKLRDWTTKPVNVAKKTGSAVAKGGKKVGKAIGNAASKSTSFVKRNSKKIMAILTILLTISTCVMTAVHLIHLKQDKKAITYCTTPACIEAANNILRNLHPSVQMSKAGTESNEYVSEAIDPCKHFDQFVCGGFQQRYDLRADQGDMFTGSLIADNVYKTLRHIVERPSSKASRKDEVIFKKLKDSYAACMDEEEIKKAGLKPLKEVVNNVKKLFPVTEPYLPGPHAPQQVASWKLKTTADAMTQTLAYLMRTGIETLVSFRTGADDKSPTQQAIFASPVQAIGLPSSEYYKDESIMTEYRNIIKSTLAEFYDFHTNASAVLYRSSDPKSVDDLARGVADFEVKLSMIIPAREDVMIPEKSYNKMSLTKFSNLLPQVSVRKLIRELGPTGYEADDIIVSSPEYLSKLSFHLQMTPKEIQQAFFVWKTIQGNEARVEDPVLKPLNDFNAKLKGARKEQPSERWRRCIQEANQDIGWILSKLYVSQHFPPTSKTTAEKIVKFVKTSFASILSTKKWMTSDDRKAAAEKVLAIDQKIGYPTTNPNVLDSASVQKYYADLDLGKDYIANKLNVAKFGVMKQWSKLGKPTDETEWNMYATTVNAYYNPHGNDMSFPAALLQGPVFYDSSVPDYITYGSFGAVAGHEISHSVDAMGSHYDKHGNLTEWWSSETKREFDKKAQCFVDQYAKFTVSGPLGDQNVNGKLTLAENMADAGGAHAAFDAWKKQRNSNAIIPGLEHFSKEQVFWLSFGNWWCSKTTKERAVERLLTDTHAPKPVRILGTVANSRAFREAFNCPVKEPTCDLW